MTNRTSEQAFADAASGMVNALPIGDILTRLVKDCANVVNVEAAAILVLDAHEELSLLASSSSAATQLELLQTLDVTGPCVDVIRTGEQQAAAGAAEMTGRWGEVGTAIVEAGFTAVHAYPLAWHGQVLGGLNLFSSDSPTRAPMPRALCQAFADVATIVVVNSAEVPADELTARVHRATMQRQLIEQAKGVLSELYALDIASAGLRLEESAAAEHLTLPEMAQQVIDAAANRRTNR